MTFKKNFPGQANIALQLLHWTLLIIPVSVSIGLLVAFFLWLLDLATVTRQQHIWLILLLPFAGILITWLYSRWGKNSDAGNNLIMDEIHQPGGGIPARLTPLILFTTVLTHLTGGSAGREGTAVQMGGSMAALFSKWYQPNPQQKRTLLMCGMSAGFGAVFGTPVAGAIFATEVLAIGRIKYDALIPCFIAAVIADITCSLVGIHHTQYLIHFSTSNNYDLPKLLLLLKVIIAGVIFGVAGFLFAELTHFIKDKSRQFIRNKYLIPVTGALLVLGISLLIGNFDYLGLGVSNPAPGSVSIQSAFFTGGATHFSWVWKLLLTAITIGMGFKGGEVTPLFFIGATLGNSIASISGAPVDLFAGLGFIAVFAAATNTPIACTLMGAELFGAGNIFYFAAACFTAYYFSGHTGVYHAQRVAVTKFHHQFRIERSLQQIRQLRQLRQKRQDRPKS
ncbi:voltage-gated chloride channel family protein [Pseudobacter ginsenosidimutans]|uniref:H+/Cl-antiporter ClcA n=1 Tax=Pseudobacter ginsenosidimutans TaxID=661488 RepID=A0A4Q7MAW7_9BACT|nr:voltage-gated chloride channel family protein [Pseudobacter ginsenosidimutans]QEC42768.1 voltage-gated chloride channel family protein [Pseudobacter ginsenosidimutans]RZS65074.1 H+/Cl- antiporter ClcA [Pseudobacter ginsenosidimutans]